MYPSDEDLREVANICSEEVRLAMCYGSINGTQASQVSNVRLVECWKQKRHQYAKAIRGHQFAKQQNLWHFKRGFDYNAALTAPLHCRRGEPFRNGNFATLLQEVFGKDAVCTVTMAFTIAVVSLFLVWHKLIFAASCVFQPATQS